MRVILALIAACVIFAPTRQAVAHDGYYHVKKYRIYQQYPYYKYRASQRRHIRRYYIHEPHGFIAHNYSDYPAWAGIAFTPQGRR